MAAHAAVPASRRATGSSTLGWALPATLGVIYGFYAAFIEKSGAPVTWGLFWLGLISAIVLAGAVYGLHRVRRALPRELHAAAWGGLAGIAVGFLYSLSDVSILSATVLGLIVGGSVTAGAFYLYYTHEDAAGRPAPY
ncbi:hypothetical protein [Streptomyces sp. NBC_00094]|uniref:hypothetical protein n=1 Tax=Streptomyces sp. NBC_00094 TaxID=2903620 RepID=UPI0022571FFD|nr:hypothetical protein [Streptomyces sp. NBC_00094]MCX5391745.1 hypothetical protein [Streptomyces sp. NBC_00094]